MILDERTEFADAVSVVGGPGRILVGDVIDLTVARDIGNLAKAVFLVVTVDTEIITGGAAGTLSIELVSDAQAAIATDGTATLHYKSRDYVTDDAGANDAALNAGGRLVTVALPLEGPVYERFLGVIANIGTTATTAGKINAFLTMDPEAWKAYPDGTTGI